MTANLILKISNIDELTINEYLDIVEKLSKINKYSVEDELTSFPGIYSYYYGLLTFSKSKLDRAELILQHHKSSFLSDRRKERKISAVEGEDLVNSQKETRELENDVLNKTEIYGYLKGICSTLEHKKDMLVQLSANQRQETRLHQ